MACLFLLPGFLSVHHIKFSQVPYTSSGNCAQWILIEENFRTSFHYFHKRTVQEITTGSPFIITKARGFYLVQTLAVSIHIRLLFFALKMNFEHQLKLKQGKISKSYPDLWVVQWCQKFDKFNGMFHFESLGCQFESYLHCTEEKEVPWKMLNFLNTNKNPLLNSISSRGILFQEEWWNWIHHSALYPSCPRFCGK